MMGRGKRIGWSGLMSTSTPWPNAAVPAAKAVTMRAVETTERRNMFDASFEAALIAAGGTSRNAIRRHEPHLFDVLRLKKVPMQTTQNRSLCIYPELPPVFTCGYPHDSR